MKTRAIVIDDFGDRAHLAEIGVPGTGTDEVLVRVLAASLNAFDWKVAEGRFRENFTYDFPVTIGRDYAGVVEQVGADVRRVQPGDAVLGYFTGQTLSRGAFAEHVWVSEDECFVAKPEQLSFTDAACLPLSGIVARRCVEAVVPADGEHHVVLGAPGGVGSFAVQMLARGGANVIASGLPEDEEYLLKLGAAEVVDYGDGFVDLIRARYPDGVEGLLDLVSYRPQFMEHVAVLRPGGRAASLHRAADPDALEPLGVTGVNVTSAPDRELLAAVAAEAAAGELRVPVEGVIRFEDAPDALDRLRDEHTRGKLVLAISGS